MAFAPNVSTTGSARLLPTVIVIVIGLAAAPACQPGAGTNWAAVMAKAPLTMQGLADAST